MSRNDPVLVGPFEETEKGTGIASEVAKVKGQDPATPGCLREDRVKRYVGDSQSGTCPFGSLRGNSRTGTIS